MTSHSNPCCGSAFARLIETASLPSSNLVLVPLTGSDLPTVVDAKTYTALRNQGFPKRWFFNSDGKGAGYVKARLSGFADVTIARFIPATTPKRFRVRFKNGESRDLRASNIRAVALTNKNTRIGRKP